MEASEEWVADENEKNETEATIAVLPKEGEGDGQRDEEVDEEEEIESPDKVKEVSPSKNAIEQRVTLA